MDITKFSEKLNKLNGNIYTIEEVVNPVDGIYEADLEHDNIDTNTINIYTGSKLTGDKINTYTISTPSITPWRTHIRIFSNEPVLYISYETVGDTVEADDINTVQDAINDTQNALNNEISRAENAETLLQQNIDNEVIRAKKAESTLTTNLNSEITRAKNAENTITTNLNAEITRAKNIETLLTNDLSSEVTRAKKAESTLTTNLSNETTRAQKAETNLDNIINTNKPIWDDKYTKNEIDNKISKVITNMSWKESVASYSDLATTYPNAKDGWTVNVKDTNITYRYDGTTWIAISANSIPLATSSVDGKMSSSDKSFLDTVKSKWTDIMNHITDAVKHITSAERTLWNTVSNKLDKSGGKISNPNYRGQLEINRDINGDDYYAEIVFSNQVKRYGGLGFSGKDGAVVSNADASSHYKIYHEGNKPKLSELTNDVGYIKDTDNIATQSHTHSNKNTLDKITESNIQTLNDITKGIGGRNYLRDTKSIKEGSKYWGKNNNPTLSLENSDIYPTNILGISGDKIHSGVTQRMKLQAGTYTLHFKAKSKTGDATKIYYGVDVYRDTGTILVNHGKFVDLTEEWTDYSLTFNISEDITVVFVLYTGATTTATKTFYAHSIKLEKGTIATDWTSAPEDLLKKGMTWNELEGV